jgi:hypothetical protein
VSIPFSRSTRSLMSDSFRPALIGLALAILTMTALILWFFLARITLYQSSATATLQEDGQIRASFSAETFAQIKPGQAAIFRLGQAGDQRPVTIPAQVFDTQGGNEDVLLIITDASALPVDFSANQEGRVDVKTESIAPVELLLRAAGKFLSRNQTAAETQTAPQTTSP